MSARLRRAAGPAPVAALALATVALATVALACQYLPPELLPQLPGAAGEPVVYRQPGTFHVATRARPYRLIELPVPSGARYRRAHVEFDFYLARFHSRLFHTVTTLRGDGLFYSLALRGGNRKTIFELGGGGDARKAGPWREGGYYHLEIDYDVGAGTARLVVRQAGKVMQRLEAPVRRGALAGGRGKPLRLDFSQRRVNENAFFPLWGSRFSNLVVRLEP